MFRICADLAAGAGSFEKSAHRARETGSDSQRTGGCEFGEPGIAARRHLAQIRHGFKFHGDAAKPCQHAILHIRRHNARERAMAIQNAKRRRTHTVAIR